ncbi:flavocytochrome c [Mesosutterella multiformis]|jgi:urocanate reductase|uniref:flavocytochrome c n=1 Tax=Mesosutterella multiformis TaxID=2259133 RepID=UPI000E48701D|nr:flavocytochrome c [Mesosutterella multiformis]MBS5812947.1 flavocytochrome c [Sutterella sp.]RGU74298.1 flavocytochrome c [Sutterella sp. AF15-45LB]RGU75204.1 flavocytochrome c [Sutterella sp. AF15-44LB]RHH04366.1 flavocytochrome c [Sutterella sp. AM18-8-1]MBM6982737.1 flavocytochrome c [Mesosutterella multiformis]
MKFAFKPIAIAAALAFIGTAAVASPMKPGTYTAKVNGHNAPLTVEVTVDANKILSIKTPDDQESLGVGKVGLKKTADNILRYQSIGVDAVTGATFSSNALKEGVEKCLKQAGADMKQFTRKAEKHPIHNRTYQADVVVIGGGGAGLASAISSMQAGAKKVIVLEKLGYVGGSTNVSEGALNAVDDQRQKAQGIKDSYETFYETTMHGGHDKGDPTLVRFLTSHSMDAVNWLESLGVKFNDHIGAATGSLGQRSHYPATPYGNTYIRTFEKVIADSNGKIQVLLDTPAVKLIQNKSGRVVGVVGNNFGSKVTVMAKDGVIIATGGFGANVAYRQKVNTGVWKNIKLDNSIGCTNIQKAAQGQGLFLAQKVGAKLIGLSDIQIHPCGTPGTGLMENIRTSGRNRIFVNSDGNRFVNEGAARDVLANAIFQQKGRTYWIVVNKLRYPTPDFKDRMGASIRNMEALGAVVEAPTLDELAKKTGMNAENLKKAIADYNAVVSGKAKDKLGFVANNKDDKQMTEGPWYACRKVPTVHHTMGGIKINVKSQVINTKGKVIPGLYAVGEVTGGIHGSNRLGGNAIADIMTFGHAVGPHIVQGK